MNRRDWLPWFVALVVFVSVLWADRVLQMTVGGPQFGTGYVPNPDGVREFLGELERPTLRQAAPDLVDSVRGVDAYLYRFADKCHRQRYGKPFGPLNQGSAGTCVGHGWSMGSYVTQAVDHVTGSLAECPLLVDVSGIYGGSRTAGRVPPIVAPSTAGWSDGSYGGAAARWVSGKCKQSGIGGILYRQKYGDIDLTDYSIDRCRKWGNYGVPPSLAKEANKHTARSVALCEDWASLTSAIESGMCVPVCSNVGFASGDRDADGFCRRAGQWSHCLCLISVKYARNNGPGSAEPMKNPRDGVLVINSWGNYVGGGKHPSDQPDGTFWITQKDCEAIIAQSDSFVIGSVDGFKPRKLDNRDWMDDVRTVADDNAAQ